jgi:hypothetical protein
VARSIIDAGMYSTWASSATSSPSAPSVAPASLAAVPSHMCPSVPDPPASGVCPVSGPDVQFASVGRPAVRATPVAAAQARATLATRSGARVATTYANRHRYPRRREVCPPGDPPRRASARLMPPARRGLARATGTAAASSSSESPGPHAAPRGGRILVQAYFSTEACPLFCGLFAITLPEMAPMT